MSICRAIQVLGLPLYHISRHVASTFKRLATLPHTLTLSIFINTDGVTFRVMILYMTPSIIFIVIAE
jgi:hypothetical protein